MTNGSCICKTITYTFTGQPVQRVICHCLQCQKLSGTAFTYNLMVPKESFSITSASKPKKSSFMQEAGVRINYMFCPDCGTTLYKTAEGEAFAPFVLVQAGSVDDEGEGVKEKPQGEIWVSRRAGWVHALDGVEQREQF